MRISLLIFVAWLTDRRRLYPPNEGPNPRWAIFCQQKARAQQSSWRALAPIVAQSAARAKSNSDRTFVPFFTYPSGHSPTYANTRSYKSCSPDVSNLKYNADVSKSVCIALYLPARPSPASFAPRVTHTYAHFGPYPRIPSATAPPIRCPSPAHLTAYPRLFARTSPHSQAQIKPVLRVDRMIGQPAQRAG